MINVVTVQGRLTGDPELRHTSVQGTPVLRLPIAVNMYRKSKTEEGKFDQETTFIDVKILGDQATRLAEELHTGMQVFVAGQLKQDRWEKDGQKRSKIYIHGRQISVVKNGNGLPAEAPQAGAKESGTPAAEAPAAEQSGDEDIPF